MICADTCESFVCFFFFLSFFFAVDPGERFPPSFGSHFKSNSNRALVDCKLTCFTDENMIVSLLSVFVRRRACLHPQLLPIVWMMRETYKKS